MGQTGNAPLNSYKKCFIYVNYDVIFITGLQGGEKSVAHFLKENSYQFINHPLFQNVRIAKLAGRDQHSPVGVCLLEIEEGAEIPVHTHEESVDSIYVIAGNGEIFAEGKWQKASAGDYCLVPAGEEHGVRNRTDRKLRLFVVHTPPLF